MVVDVVYTLFVRHSLHVVIDSAGLRSKCCQISVYLGCNFRGWLVVNVRNFHVRWCVVRIAFESHA